MEQKLSAAFQILSMCSSDKLTIALVLHPEYNQSLKQSQNHTAAGDLETILMHNPKHSAGFRRVLSNAFPIGRENTIYYL